MHLNRIITFVVSCLCLCFSTYAQDRKNTLKAKIVFMEEVFTTYKHEEATPQKCIALSFINNSDQDIFVPYFLKLINNKDNQGTFSCYYQKTGSEYKLMLRPQSLGYDNVAGVGMSGGYPYKHKVENDKLLLFIKEHYKGINAEKLNDLLSGFYTRSLFIKAHEEKAFYILLSLDPIRKPGDYKITFEPLLTLPTKDEYPEYILNYKKFFPSEINSSPFYLHFEKLVREDR
jgi:hypothetical protein